MCSNIFITTKKEKFCHNIFLVFTIIYAFWCKYFSLVARPPRMCRSDLLTSSTVRAFAARAGLILRRRSVTSLSLLGLLNLGLNRKIELRVYEEECQELFRNIEQYVVAYYVRLSLTRTLSSSPRSPNNRR